MSEINLNVDSMDKAFEQVTKVGVSILHNYVSVDLLRAACLENSSPNIEVLSTDVNLGRIIGEFRWRNLPLINTAKRFDTECGSSSPPHIDDRYSMKGISLLLPVTHCGNFALHANENPHYKLAEEFFFPGDVLFLRQDIPKSGKKAAWHSSCSVSRAKDEDFEYRSLLTLDHILD